MNVVHSRSNPPSISPQKAISLLRNLYLWTPLDSSKKKELEKFIADFPPSQRDQNWADQVSAYLESNFKSALTFEAKNPPPLK